MIESIELQNFLSHKKTKMIFGRGVNAIVGLTDSGKSAIIQGFRWVADNRPIGDGYRSNWGGTTKVIIRTESGSVTRIKSDSVNKYIVRTKDQVLPLVGFGTKVPEPVQAFLNMTSTNLQTQMETHYLLGKPIWSAGEVASHFNKVAHLHKIDIGRKNISTDLKRLEHKIEADNTEVGRLKEEAKEYAGINKIEKKIIAIEELNFRIVKIHNSKINLNINISQLIEIEKEIEELSVLLPVEKLVDQILEYQDTISNQEVKIESLNTLIFGIRECTYEIRCIEKFLKMETQVNLLLKVEKEIQVREISYSKLESTIKYLNMIIYKEQSVKKELKTMQKTLDDNMGEICVLCGFKLKKKYHEKKIIC